MKMKEKTKKRIRGSISVLLVIILLPMMTFSAVIVDLSRINMAKQMMSSAGDLTMNTALANYDTILKDVYGLFAMSQAKGMTNDELGTELNKYFANTLSSYGVVSKDEADDYVAELIGDFRNILNEGSLDTKNFLELSNIELAATKVEGSSLANASVMRKQIVEYMKYRAPMELGLGFLDSLTSFKKLDAQNKVVEAQVKAQESTQDVTKACQTLINLIREYDKRVVEIDKALIGVTGSSDATVIPLEDYDTHVSKYLLDWEENYTHINKLNLVFLANSPSADGVYLKALNYNGGVRYINFNGNVYSGSDTGISVAVELAGDTASAKGQIDQQITNLNTNYKQYADKYSASMLPSTLLTLNANNISKSTFSKENEDAAIDSFIRFEKFLLDQSENGSITYSQAKSVLEQISVLWQYKGNYEKWINADIQTATRERDEAKSSLDSLVASRDAAAAVLGSCIAVIGEGNAYGTYDGYYNGLAADKSQNHTNKYIESFEILLDIKSSNTIAQKASEYVSAHGYDPTEFEQHMKGVLSEKEEKDNLFTTLCRLLVCNQQASIYQKTYPEYAKANGQIPDAEEDLTKKENKLTGLKNEKTTTIQSVTGCLQGYAGFSNAYQADAYHYNHYINAAKNTVGAEAKKIQTHFVKLLGYLKELRDDLDAIDKQVVVVKTAITTYNNNLNTWESANNTYKTSNGGDSFSSQTSDDIAKSRTEYDAKLYETLDTFVVALWNEFDTLYSKLTESTNFVYGSKRIDKIGTAQDLINAVSGESFSAVVTVEEASQKLTTLYKGETVQYVPYTMDYPDGENGKQLTFLTPRVLQIQALKYLNSAYPEEIVLTCGGCGSEDCTQCKLKKDAADTKAEYETTKAKLKGDDKTIDASTDEGDGKKKGNAELPAGEEVSDEVTADFGYTFASKSISGSLPSGLTQTTSKEFSDTEYKLTESGSGDDAKLNASSSVSGQTSKTSSVLSGIANIATTAVENLYILSYVFENFSYNTIVQDQIIDDGELKNETVVGQIAEVQTLFSDAEVVSAAKEKTTTLSNYAINSKNNHLYGGEIEYILFGKSNPSTNVTSAKASIYAIRFGFNCIFAFTDAEIRNTTMSAGLAVQAATLGIVPYQVVQIVLQLALAAAESAIDLSAMSHGLSVAIVKTKDTWSLSYSGAANALKDAGNAAAQMAADKLSGVVVSAVSSVTNGLNDLVGATADQLKGAIYDLQDNMVTAAEGVLQSVADKVVTSVMAEIEAGLNELQYVNVGNTTVGELVDQLPTKADVRAKAVSLFQTVRGKVPSIISEACGDNAMAQAVASMLQIQANNLLTSMEAKVLSEIDAAGDDVDITAYIADILNGLKLELIGLGNSFISGVANNLTRAASTAVSQSSAQLQEYISRCGDELSEEAATAIKKEVQSFTDNFVETTLKVGGGSADSADVKSSPVSMFRFGYKDYLMLLTYISICCGDSVLVRTADVIQLNLQNAGEGAEFQHKANTDESQFLMSKAYTYVSISASADLGMFFMDIGLFADQVKNDDAAEGETAETSTTKITYQGILGY